MSCLRFCSKCCPFFYILPDRFIRNFIHMFKMRWTYDFQSKFKVVWTHNTILELKIGLALALWAKQNNCSSTIWNTLLYEKYFWKCHYSLSEYTRKSYGSSERISPTLLFCHPKHHVYNYSALHLSRKLKAKYQFPLNSSTLSLQCTPQEWSIIICDDPSSHIYEHLLIVT